MAEDRIDSIIDVAAIQAELDVTEKGIADLVALIKSVKGAAIGVTDAKGSGDYTKKAKELSTIMTNIEQQYKAVQGLLNQRFATEAKLATLQTDYAKQTARNTEEIKKTNKELRAQAAYEAAAPNSLERVRALRAKIRQEVDKTNLNDGARIAQLNDRINKLTAIEKKFTDAQRQQSLNVGNYQGSAKIIVDALERIRLKQEQVNKEFGEGSPEAAGVRREYEALSRVTANPQFLNVAAKFGDASKEVAFFRKQLVQLKTDGQEGSEAFKLVQKRLAELTDEIGDTRQEIKALSSDTRSFDLFAGAVSFAADTFQTAAGAAVLFGASEEDAAQATATLTAVMSISNGVKGIANELTTKGTFANKAFVIVQRMVNTVMKEGIATAKGLKSALGLLGIAVTVIGALAAAFGAFKRRATEAEKAQKALNETLEAGKDAYAGAVQSVDSMKTAIAQAKAGIISKEAAVRQYNDTIGKVTGEVKNLDEAEQALVKNGPRYIEFMFLKAQATYALGEAAKLAVDAQIEAQKAQSAIDQAGNQRLPGGGLFSKGPKVADFIKKQSGEAIAELKKSEERFKKIQADIQKRLDSDFKDFTANDNQYQQKINEEKKKKEEEDAKKKLDDQKKAAEEGKRLQEEANKKAEELRQRNAEAEFNSLKLQTETRAANYKAIADDENVSYAERIEALRLYGEERKKLIEDQANFDKSKKGLTAKEITYIEQKAQADQLENRREYYARSIELYYENQNKEKEAAEARKKEMDDISDQVRDELTAKMDAALEKTLENFKKEEEAYKDLQEKKKALTISLATELQNTLFTFLTVGIEQQKNALQEQLNQLEIQKAREIELAGGNADAIAAIEARAQVQKEAIQRKQRELDIKKAQFEKAQAIARIIQETAIAIVSSLKNPTLIPLIIAIGAAQLAQVIATPIPRYKDGGKHGGGPMIVGDGGRAEGIVFPDGTTMKSPATSTLMDAPAGTVIHKDFNKMMFNSTMTKPVEYKAAMVTDSNLKVVKGLKAVEKAIGKIPQPNITVQNVLKQRIRYGHAINEHLTRNLGK